MANKTYKFVTILMVMLLVLGLTLAACKSQTPAETVTPPAETVTPPAEQPPATPPAAHQLTYTAKTYTNSQYGFSIQYPDNWVERPEIAVGTIVAAFGVPGFVPGVSASVRDADAPMTADWVVAADTAEGNTDVKVTSPLTETTLDDGTPAVQYTQTYMSSGGYSIVAFAISTDKNGKRIRASVWTIDAFSPYDEALSSEVTHTLSVK
jgi:predicted small lipoprotein YifL